MKKWRKWVLGCCVCLIAICTMESVALAGETQGIDEVEALAQRVENAKQELDELTTQIEELKQWADTLEKDTLRGEFDRLEDKLNGWIQNLLTIVSIAITLIALWGTVFAPRQAERALIKKTEQARSELKKAEERLEAVCKERVEAIEEMAVLKQDYDNLRGEYDSRIKQLEKAQIKMDQTLDEMRENLKEIKEQRKQADQAKIEIQATTAYNEGVSFFRDKKYEEAVVKFEKATQLNPSMYAAWIYWGGSLENLASTKIGKEGEVLYQQAVEKYKKAIEIDSERATAWNNWGATLGRYAGSIHDEKKAKLLYNEAMQKFEIALQNNPNNKYSWDGWISAKLSLYRFIKGSEGKKKLLNEIYNKTLNLDESIKEFCAYNLSCTYSLLRQPDNAYYWLERYLNNETIVDKVTLEHIKDDKDLDSIKSDPRFATLIKKHYGVDWIWPPEDKQKE